MKRPIKIIVSGGGTGGHIFPAISIANAVKEKSPEADILFVGAESRMEMEKVPAAGYRIVGLPISGFDRKNPFRNIKVLFRLWKSLGKARKTIQEFRPDVVVGVGGYASGPTLWTASRQGIPMLIQEQNSYAGVTNKLLASKASSICVAYEGMKRFFPKDKIVLTGNPVRQDLLNPALSKEEARRFFELEEDKKTILVIGGSLGARTINESVADYLDQIVGQPVQFIWQTGKCYDDKAKHILSEKTCPNVKQMPFIARMDMAYKAADLVISRAGASSISELCLLGKPAILVPSPNVAEDHQTKNAMALQKKDAAFMVPDDKARDTLIPLALDTVKNDAHLEALSRNVQQLAQTHSAERIADIILGLIKERND